MFKKIQIFINNSTFYTNKLAIELAHLIGFKSVAMEFPLIAHEKAFPGDTLYFSIEENQKEGFKSETADNAVNLYIAGEESAVRKAYEYVSENFYILTGDFQRSSHETKGNENFTAAKAMQIPPFDKRAYKELESLFDKDYILLDENNDLLPDRLNAKITLKSDYSKEQVEAASHIAARLGLETTAASYPITCTDEEFMNVFLFRSGEECSMTLAEENGCRKFIIQGDGKKLVDFSTALCENFPIQKPGSRWLDILNEMTASLCMQTVDGQLAHMEHMKAKISSGTNCYFSPGIKNVDEIVLKDYAPAHFYGYKDLKKVYEKEYELPWEVDVCRNLLNEKLLPNVHTGDKVEIRAILSEDKEIRTSLAGELKNLISGKGAELKSAEVICAYKQGFSWLEEIVMPKLLGMGKVEKVEIFFKPFLAPGVSDWQDEDGAVPSYNNIKTDTEDKWFDLPIRYLQELYPIDDILSIGLCVNRNDIVFSEYTGEEDITYLVKAFQHGKELYTETYKATASERNYIDAYPGMGKVHPGTGWIWAAVNGREVISRRIPTDVELVWQIYQEDVLPCCHEYCQKKTGGKPTTADQPFFAQMRLDIQLSEPNEKIACREDLISSLDTLHEDIYFTGLDFFKVYGNTTEGKIFDAPGLILPVIKKRHGKPYFRFTLFDQHGLEPAIDFNGQYYKAPFKKEDLKITIPVLEWKEGKLSPVIRIEGPRGLSPLVQSYTKLLSEHKLNIEKRMAKTEEIQFKLMEDGKEHKFTAKVCEAPEPPKDLNIEEIDILKDKLIGYDEYLKIIDQLKRVSGLNVYRAAESYLGRDIYAIEFTTDYRGYVSRTKLINQNPSLLIIARHHANEVSSTNAAFMLVKELLTGEDFKQLSRRVNIVMAPFTNADGAAIHYELQKDNPAWILHIARFNAIGREFYYEYFKDDTLHTEALCATKLWRDWLPDIIVDNHGVPTHEWAQQFSGYTSPSYKGFWLPRSLLYGCYWTVKEECWNGNLPIAKKMEEIIANVMTNDKEVRGWNLEWQERFAKYANKWMPCLFPANYYKDMVNVWVPFDYDPGHRYPSVRYPWITTVAYTSEVTDETAHGPYLNLVARVHKMHDIEVIKMMRESKCVYNEGYTKTEEGTSQKYFRQRPIISR